MKILQVVPRIEDQASGPSYSVPRLCETLGQLGGEVHLHVLAPAPNASPTYRLHPHSAWRFLARLGISPAMRRALQRETSAAEVMHNHSLWMMPNLYPAWAVRGMACRLITSPRGTLSPWSLRRSAWRKRVIWLFGQGRAVRASHALHATAESEYYHIRAAGLRGPVAIVPNGIDLGPPPSGILGANGRRRLLFLGRLHPVKGVDLLLQAWQRIESRFPDWELRIVGGGEAIHVNQLRRLADCLGIRRATFFEAVFGLEKKRQFQQADLFVLPSHSENFAVAAAEALAHGLPAIVTKGAPWSGLESHDCGWWIDRGVDSLADCLRIVLALTPQQLRAKGLRGRRWMEQEYSWDRVGRMMLETYRWLVGGGASPAWVQLN